MNAGQKTSTAKDFQTFLRENLLSRCKKNPQYSLRSFARSLAISPSALSAMMSGKRPITEKMKLRLGLGLGLSRTDVLKFQNRKKLAEKATQKRQQIALDTFAVIADWYHYALLELTRVQGFKSNPKWAARALGISTTEINLAIERLQRLGLLKIDDDGQWLDLSADGLLTNIHGDETSLASKQLQKQVLELSLKALQELPTSVRNHTSLTMAIAPEDFPEAIQKITDFRREMCAFFDQNPNPKQVYNLNIGLYPITKKEGENL